MRSIQGANSNQSRPREQRESGGCPSLSSTMRRGRASTSRLCPTTWGDGDHGLNRSLGFISISHTSFTFDFVVKGLTCHTSSTFDKQVPVSHFAVITSSGVVACVLRSCSVLHRSRHLSTSQFTVAALSMKLTGRSILQNYFCVQVNMQRRGVGCVRACVCV